MVNRPWSSGKIKASGLSYTSPRGHLTSCPSTETGTEGKPPARLGLWVREGVFWGRRSVPEWGCISGRGSVARVPWSRDRGSQVKMSTKLWPTISLGCGSPRPRGLRHKGSLLAQVTFADVPACKCHCLQPARFFSLFSVSFPLVSKQITFGTLQPASEGLLPGFDTRGKIL